MRRFQINSDFIRNGQIILDKKESHHAASVLRLKPGNEVALMDGKGASFHGIISGIENGLVRVNLKRDQTSHDIPKSYQGIQIDIAVSVIKPERMEFIIEKACELGVRGIFPIRTERSVVKLSPERWQMKIKRWQKIAAESCKQCGLKIVPDVHDVLNLKDILSGPLEYDMILIPTLAVPTRPLYGVLTSKSCSKLLSLIGPEGDFTAKEVELAASRGAIPVSLGRLVLRAETASINLISNLNFFYREIAQKD